MYPIIVKRDSKVFSSCLEYSIALISNEVGTVWRCLDDNKQPFEIVCFSSSPEQVSIYPVGKP